MSMLNNLEKSNQNTTFVFFDTNVYISIGPDDLKILMACEKKEGFTPQVFLDVILELFMHLSDQNSNKQLAALKKINQHVDTIRLNVNTVNSIPYEIAKHFNSNKAPDSKSNQHYEQFPPKILGALSIYLQDQTHPINKYIAQCAIWCKEPKNQFYAGINQFLAENISPKDCIEALREQFQSVLYDCMPTRTSNDAHEIFPSCFKFLEIFFKKVLTESFYKLLGAENKKKHANNFYVDALLLAFFDVITSTCQDKFIFVTNETAMNDINPQNFEIMSLCEYKTRVGFSNT